MNRSRIKNHEGLLTLNFLAILVCTVSLSACSAASSQRSDSSSSNSSANSSSSGGASSSGASSSGGGCVAPSGTAHVSTLAGTISAGTTDGTGTAAQFNHPFGLAIDSADHIFVTDNGNHTIRKITPAGVVTTFAGSSASSGSTDGTGTAATFTQPYGIAIDPSDNLFVTDKVRHVVRKITPAGVVTTFAGSASSGSSDGTGTGASFFLPRGIAIDDSGNFYVGDSGNSLIRKIDSSGVVSTFATGIFSQFATITGGSLYTASGTTIKQVTSQGVISVFAGSATQGGLDGTGAAARFYSPWGFTADCAGNLYVGDYFVIRKITPDGVVTTIAGEGGAFMAGNSNGDGTQASFWETGGLAFDSSSNLYVADMQNNLIRKISFY